MNHQRKPFFKRTQLFLATAVSFITLQPAIAAIDTAYFDKLQTEKVISNPDVEWTGASPANAGYIDQFWVHPTDPNVLFQYPDLDNAYGSWDHGERWYSIQDSDDDDRFMSSINSMDFSSQNANLGMALAKQGVFLTKDRGHTWKHLSTVPTENRTKHNIIEVDPNNDNNWFVGAGQSAMLKYTHVTKSGIDRLLERNHSYGFINKSTDQGKTWTLISEPFPADTDFNNIIVDPRNNGKVYASTQYGVYISADSGDTWSLSSGTGLPHNKPRDMDSYYNSDTKEFYLYIVEQTHYEQDGTTVKTTGGVYRSNDGNNWGNLTGNLAIDLNEITQNEYKARYYRAVAHWLEVPESEVKNNFGDIPTSTFSQFSGIEVDPSDPNRVYIVHNYKHDYSFPPGNIWMTEDGGTSWIAVAREGLYWINGVDKAYWDGRNQPTGMNATFTHVAPEHTDDDFIQSGPRFLEIASNGDLYSSFSQQTVRSTDKGNTWLQIDDIETSPGSKSWVGRGHTNMPGETILADTGRPGEVLLGSGEHGLWRVQDDGDLAYPGAIAIKQLAGQSNTDYTQAYSTREPFSISSIATHPYFPERIYTLHFRQTQFGKLRYSADNGGTWSTLSNAVAIPSGTNFLRQKSLLIDPIAPDNMMFTIPVSDNYWYNGTRTRANGGNAFTEHGIYQSTDGGLSWVIAPTPGIPEGTSIFQLRRDPTNPKIIYAAANRAHTGIDGGLYKSLDNGVTWSNTTLPANTISVNEVRVHPTSGNVYIATGTFARNDGGKGGAYVSKDGGENWELIFDMEKVYHVAVSPLDENIMMVVVHFSQKTSKRNPGAYASVDGGSTWQHFIARRDTRALVNSRFFKRCGCFCRFRCYTSNR